MNIFVLDSDAWISGQMVSDRHSVKMPLETAQMLCTGLIEHGVLNTPDATKVPYKATHKNHPSTVWARENREQFEWLGWHGLSLCNTYQQRYGRKHKCEAVIKECIKLSYHIPEGDFQLPPQCMGDEYKVEGDTVAAYQNYYLNGKQYMNKGTGPQWNKGVSAPQWWTNGLLKKAKLYKTERLSRSSLIQ